MLTNKYHYDKIYFDNPKPCGDFVLYQSGEMLCSKDTVIDQHDQFCFEISYVVSGEGVFLTNSIPTKVKKDDCYFSFDKEKHKIVSSESVPLRYRFLGFNSYENSATMELLKTFSLFKEENKRTITAPELNELFLKIFDEIENENLLSDKMIGLIINQMLILILREFEHQSNIHIKLEATTQSMLVYQITNYLDNNILEIKNLYQLSDIFNYNYQYLSSVFTQIMQISLKDYYTKIKMEKAKNLLSDETLSITALSEQLNYSSIHAFTKAFSNYYKINPTQYRLSINKNIKSRNIKKLV